jgi:hypothetical protein
MSQILLRRLSAAHSHSHRVRGHGCRRRLSSAVYGDGGERRRASFLPPQQDEETRAVPVSVWWDFENCNIPNGVNVCRVAPRVSAALRAAGIRGPLSITAFGDVLQLARSAQEELTATGVSISHVPRSFVLVPAPLPPFICCSVPFHSLLFVISEGRFGASTRNSYHTCSSSIKNDFFVIRIAMP